MAPLKSVWNVTNYKIYSSYDQEMAVNLSLKFYWLNHFKFAFIFSINSVYLPKTFCPFSSKNWIASFINFAMNFALTFWNGILDISLGYELFVIFQMTGHPCDGRYRNCYAMLSKSTRCSTHIVSFNPISLWNIWPHDCSTIIFAMMCFKTIKTCTRSTNNI